MRKFWSGGRRLLQVDSVGYLGLYDFSFASTLLNTSEIHRSSMAKGPGLHSRQALSSLVFTMSVDDIAIIITGPLDAAYQKLNMNRNLRHICLILNAYAQHAPLDLILTKFDDVLL